MLVLTGNLAPTTAVALQDCVSLPYGLLGDVGSAVAASCLVGLKVWSEGLGHGMLICFAGVMPASQILDSLVRRGLLSRGQESYQTQPILDTMSTLPAAQQVPMEVFGCLLQCSACHGHLRSALLKYPQAQHITPVVLCKALLVAAKSGFELLVPPFLR
jgi:hypothetical protein